MSGSFIETIRAKYDAPKPVHTGAPAPVVTFSGDVHPYAAAALNQECAIIANTLEGERNTQLNTSTVKIASLVAGGYLPENDSQQALLNAARAAGLDDGESLPTLRSGWKHGTENPRTIPDRKEELWLNSLPMTGPSALGAPATDASGAEPAPTAQAQAPTPSAGPAPSPTDTASATAAAAPVQLPWMTSATPSSNSGSGTPTTNGSETTQAEGLEERAKAGSLTDEDRAYLLRLQRHRATMGEVERQRSQREARRILDQEEHLATFRVPPYRATLTAELLIPEEPIAYTIDQVLPRGGNVLLTAAFKTGKTTFVNHLTKCLADDEPFLNKYQVNADDARIALFNYEVHENQYRTWLRDLNVRNTDAISVLNLRGYRLPITVSKIEDWIVNWLQEHRISVWVVDPFARAFTGSGTSENDNTEVGRFLDTLDVIKARAGVNDLILPTHTGREKFEEGEERARGATRLDDWADVRWTLTKDEEDIRFFRASGRDVEIPETKLSFDEKDRSLMIGGGDRRWEKRRRMENAVVAAVAANPGCSHTQLRGLARQQGASGKPEIIDNYINAVVGEKRITMQRAESNGLSHHYWPLGTIPPRRYGDA